MRKERQLEGIAAAKAKGAYTGRKPTAQAKKPEILALVEQGVSKVDIAKQVGVSVAGVCNVLKAD
ncbi:helix-turn-helix domain-containing protein [Leucothrix arctica]|uniref:helix-turn-helix domain-containing protein n=1 Tax=Leucothrix arctica TaxID=1481894 RepID=UPI00319E28A5